MLPSLGSYILGDCSYTPVEGAYLTTRFACGINQHFTLADAADYCESCISNRAAREAAGDACGGIVYVPPHYYEARAGTMLHAHKLKGLMSYVRDKACSSPAAKQEAPQDVDDAEGLEIYDEDDDAYRNKRDDDPQTTKQQQSPTKQQKRTTHPIRKAN